MNHGTLATSDISKAQFAFVLISGVGFAFGLSWAGWMWPSLTLCLVCMAYLAVLRFRQAAATKDSDSLDLFADQIYMLGYILTISAIAGVVLQSQAQTSELLKAGAVKLTTTIVGLIVMFIFKEFAHGWDQERQRATQEVDTVVNAELRAAIRGLISEADSLREKVGGVVAAFDPATLHTMAVFANQFSELMRSTTGALPPLKAAIDQTADDLDNLHPRLQAASGELVGFNNAVSQTRSAGIVPLGAELQAMVPKLSAAQGGLEVVSEAGESLGGALGRLGTTVEAEKERIAELREAFKGLVQTYGTVEKRLQNILKLHEADETAPLIQLAKSVKESADKLDALTRQLGASADQIGQIRELGLPDAAKNLAQATTALNGSTTTQAAVTPKLQSASDSLDRAAKQLIEMRATLANLTTQLERAATRMGAEHQTPPPGFIRRMFGQGPQ